MRRFWLGSIVLALLGGAVSTAQPAVRCTHEKLLVRGQALQVTYCGGHATGTPAGREMPLAVLETYATSRGSFSQNAALAFISGEDASRVIEDVALDRVGLTGILHLTLVLRGGMVHIESAILTPGAITIK
ncbi:MAG: hypothetical protein M3Y18_05300 [Candidatus Eremiobacteraeota bacterium]|nr:hypothetical protein [Candidatus Eremiobacteraeota bacterium]